MLVLSMKIDSGLGETVSCIQPTVRRIASCQRSVGIRSGLEPVFPTESRRFLRDLAAPGPYHGRMNSELVGPVAGPVALTLSRELLAEVA